MANWIFLTHHARILLCVNYDQGFHYGSFGWIKHWNGRNAARGAACSAAFGVHTRTADRLGKDRRLS